MAKILPIQDRLSKIRSVQLKDEMLSHLSLVTLQDNIINAFHFNQPEKLNGGLRTFFCIKLRSRGKKTIYSRKLFQTELSRLVGFASTSSFIH